MKKINQVVGKVFKKSFWISKTNKIDLEREAREKKVSESALMREIINSWFMKKKW